MRPVDDMVSLIYNPKFGIVFTNGETWKSQRKTFVRLLKKTGFQKSHLKSVIEHIWHKMKEPLTTAPSIVVELNEPMKSSKNESLEKVELALMELLTLIFANKATFPGGNVPRDYLENFNTYRTCGVQWIDANALWYRYPILRHLAPHWSGFVWITDMIGKTEQNLNEIVSLHKNEKEGEKEGKDVAYIESYLEEIDRTVGEDAKSDGHRALIASLEDLLLGADGIVMALYSLLYCLARNPHVQEEMRKEIREGQETESETLPYCRAVILETLRYIPQGGIGPQHYSEEDILLDGFKIPAGTDVYPNVMGIFQSKEHWDEPNVFNPKRFLDQDGQLLHPKCWIPFSIGDRTCPAKSFSQDVLFMLGVKMVTELELSFDGFVDEGVSAVNELKYYGMSLVHIHPFKMAVRALHGKDHDISVADIRRSRSTRTQGL